MLRRDAAADPEHFRAPHFAPWLAIASCLALLSQQSASTWLRAGVLVAIALALYALNRLAGSASVPACALPVAAISRGTHAPRVNENPIVKRAWGELFQTERSAERHGQVEAERFGDAPPASPLLLVSAHATHALAELDLLAQARGHEAAQGGQVVGQFFSEVRQKIADLALTREMSYRGTLLGIRHGIDLVALVHHASAESDPELHEWTRTWLEERTRLVEAAARELAWFARNPDVAEQPVSKGALADDAPRSSL